MADNLTKAGLYFDELNKIRVVEPEVANRTNTLKEECVDFIERITSFKTIADSFISIIDSLAKEVDSEKMKAIGIRNLVKSMEKQRDSQQQRLQALLVEKTTKLERLKLEHQSLSKSESEQLETIDKILLNY